MDRRVRPISLHLQRGLVVVVGPCTLGPVYLYVQVPVRGKPRLDVLPDAHVRLGVVADSTETVLEGSRTVRFSCRVRCTLAITPFCVAFAPDSSFYAKIALRK